MGLEDGFMGESETFFYRKGGFLKISNSFCQWMLNKGFLFSPCRWHQYILAKIWFIQKHYESFSIEGGFL